jgi:hypothetical protein
MAKRRVTHADRAAAQARPVTHTDLDNAGLVVDPTRPVAGWAKPSSAFAVYENEIGSPLEFGNSYFVFPRFFYATWDKRIGGPGTVLSMGEGYVIAFEVVFDRRRMVFTQLVLRGLPADIDPGGREYLRDLVEIRELASMFAAAKVRQGPNGIEIIPARSDKAKATGWFNTYRDEVKALPPQRGKQLGPEHFEKVAEVYRTALIAGRPPTQAVADAFHRPYSTAGRWVWRARHDFGLLGDAPAPGQPGEKGDDNGKR